MRTGKIKIIAFQGETDFAGGKSAAGRGAKKDKKEEKAKRKARGVIISSRCDVVIQLLFFRGTRGSPLSFLPSFYFLLF